MTTPDSEPITKDPIGRDADDVAEEGYATGTEDLPGSQGAGYDVDAEAPTGGNPASTLDEESMTD